MFGPLVSSLVRYSVRMTLCSLYEDRVEFGRMFVELGRSEEVLDSIRVFIRNVHFLNMFA